MIELPSAEELAALLADGDPAPERYDRNGKLRSAAVLLPLLESEEGPALLYTRRSRDLPHHRGQVAFPGGLRETGDRGPFDTALREACEEVGARREDVRYVARLTPTETLRRFRIEPFLSLWRGKEYRPRSLREVERVFLVPIARLLEPASRRQVLIEEEGLRLSVPAFLHEGEIIWGATYRMTEDFLDRVRKAFF